MDLHYEKIYKIKSKKTKPEIKKVDESLYRRNVDKFKNLEFIKIGIINSLV